MADQRELLAAVSHEIRTPLARIRLLPELCARDAGAERKPPWTEIDREVVEMDRLVGELLASSRLDFAALTPEPGSTPTSVARRALERAGIDASKLIVDDAATIQADATLLARALANLIDNARDHKVEA